MALAFLAIFPGTRPRVFAQDPSPLSKFPALQG